MSEPKKCIHGVNTINFCQDCYKERRCVMPAQPQQDPMKPCGHEPPQGASQLHGVCLFCYRDRLADLRQVAQGLRGELVKWTEKYRCCDGSPTCANNKLKKLCHNLLGDGEWTDKHEYLYNIVADAETSEEWAKYKYKDAQKEIADLQAKLSVATKALKFYAEPDEDDCGKLAKQALAQIEGTKMTHRDTECDNASEGEVATA